MSAVTHPRAPIDPERQTYGTPPPAHQSFAIVCGIPVWDLDPCASHERHCAEAYFTEKDDGLSRRWFGNVFCNPPFNAIGDWVDKGVEEYLQGHVGMICYFVPARVTMAWFHKLLLLSPEFVWLKGRFNFIPPKGVKVVTGAAEHHMGIVLRRPVNMLNSREIDAKSPAYKQIVSGQGSLILEG